MNFTDTQSTHKPPVQPPIRRTQKGMSKKSVGVNERDYASLI